MKELITIATVTSIGGLSKRTQYRAAASITGGQMLKIRKAIGIKEASGWDIDTEREPITTREARNTKVVGRKIKDLAMGSIIGLTGRILKERSSGTLEMGQEFTFRKTISRNEKASGETIRDYHFLNKRFFSSKS